MFTGIIETVGTITDVRSRRNYRLVTIRPDDHFADMIPGESISVDGCCLTVTEFNGIGFTVEASQETTGLTIAGDYVRGARVNLERALQPSGRLGGHFVSGHIDCRGKVVGRKRTGESLELSVQFPREYEKYIVSKGSIAINGISLTVNRIEGDMFTVNLIPFTLEMTTVNALKKGDNVNLEFDILGKYVLNLLNKEKKSDLTIDKLIESGW